MRIFTVSVVFLCLFALVAFAGIAPADTQSNQLADCCLDSSCCVPGAACCEGASLQHAGLYSANLQKTLAQVKLADCCVANAPCCAAQAACCDSAPECCVANLPCCVPGAACCK